MADDVKQFVAVEKKGIFKGRLVEDMSKTVERTKNQYINVLIEELWEEGQAYPYTWVGGWHNVPPLMEGDEVWVKFEQNNFLYPVLYKYDGAPENLYKVPGMPSNGTIVEFPTFDSDETVEGGRYIGTTGFIIETTKHLILQYDKEVFVSEKGKGAWINCTSQFNVKADKSELKMAAKIKFGQQNTLGTMVSDLLQRLIDLCKQLETLRTIGGPTTQSIDPSISLQISNIDMQVQTLKSNWEQVFE